jgi:hypothetical protein
MPRWNGIYEIKTKYDENDQTVEYSYFNSEGQSFKIDDGYSVCKLLRNESGLIYGRQFLYNEELVNISRGVSHGYSVIRYERDSSGRVNQILFYGNQHEAIDATVAIGNPVQAHRIAFVYLGGRVTEEWFYSIANDNVPFMKLDCLKHDCLNPNGISIDQKNAN